VPLANSGLLKLVGLHRPSICLAPPHTLLQVNTFTEQLGTESLQWTLPLPSVISPDRSNLAIVQQDTKPSWLSKPGFMDFGR